jgi:hypothetical protein
MEIEMETLEGDLNAWDLVYSEDWMENILPSTWAFKLKRFPDGLAKKYKARFCVRGDRHRKALIISKHGPQLFSGTQSAQR